MEEATAKGFDALLIDTAGRMRKLLPKQLPPMEVARDSPDVRAFDARAARRAAEDADTRSHGSHSTGRTTRVPPPRVPTDAEVTRVVSGLVLGAARGGSKTDPRRVKWSDGPRSPPKHGQNSPPKPGPNSPPKSGPKSPPRPRIISA